MNKVFDHSWCWGLTCMVVAATWLSVGRPGSKERGEHVAGLVIVAGI